MKDVVDSQSGARFRFFEQFNLPETQIIDQIERIAASNKLAGLPVLVHLRREFLDCDKALRAQIAQPAVRSFRVVMLSPILNNDAGFA